MWERKAVPGRALNSVGHRGASRRPQEAHAHQLDCVLHAPGEANLQECYQGFGAAGVSGLSEPKRKVTDLSQFSRSFPLSALKVPHHEKPLSLERYLDGGSPYQRVKYFVPHE